MVFFDDLRNNRQPERPLEAEITKFDPLLPVRVQHIRGFDVAVADVHSMQILNSICHLLRHLLQLAQRKEAARLSHSADLFCMLENKISQFMIEIFHAHDIVVCRSIYYDLKKPDYVPRTRALTS